MDFEEVLSVVGELGRYQKWLFLLVCVPASLPAAVTIFSHIFISDVPEHHCHPVITAEKVSLLNRSLAVTEGYQRALKTLFLPRDAEGSFSRCQQYDIDMNSVIDQVVSQYEFINSSILGEFVAQKRWPMVQCLNGWDYDTSEYIETLATKFNVVCDQEWLISTAQSAFFIGGVIGSVGFGWSSDKWGRRPALFQAMALMVIGNLAEIYPPNYFAYIAMRFIVGLSYLAVYNLAFLIVAEMMGVTKRMLASMVCHIPFSLAMMTFAYIAHYIHHWQTLQAVISVPMLLLIGYYWAVPESARWLISQGKIDEAEEVVQKMARDNGVAIPQNFLKHNLAEYCTSSSPCRQESKVGASHLLRYPRVTMKIFITSVIWTMTGMVYQGMSFAVPDLPSETYFAFFLSGFCEIPGVLFAWATMERYGRRGTMFLSLFLSGVFSTATAFVPYEIQWLAVLCPSLAKLCSSTTFTVMYIFAGELFPTVIRGFAIGVASTSSQLGLALTPYILYLGRLYGGPIPFLILGTLAGLAAFLILTLPETLNAPLPTTLAESENYTEYVKKNKESREFQPVI